MNSQLVKVSNHNREWVSRTIHHSALVIIENYDPNERDKIMAEISIKAGYHPAGYCLYDRYSKIEPTQSANEYTAIWRTSDSCD